MKLDRNGYAKSIMQDKEECFITKARGIKLDRHEIYYGTANRKISKANGFWVYLIPSLHNMTSIGVHFNREFDLQLKTACQRKFEESHTREEFRKLIGKSFL
jgi:hypothetical protein